VPQQLPVAQRPHRRRFLLSGAHIVPRSHSAHHPTTPADLSNTTILATLSHNNNPLSISTLLFLPPPPPPHSSSTVFISFLFFFFYYRSSYIFYFTPLRSRYANLRFILSRGIPQQLNASPSTFFCYFLIPSSRIVCVRSTHFHRFITPILHIGFNRDRCSPSRRSRNRHHQQHTSSTSSTASVIM
jgi:hypothetical protein